MATKVIMPQLGESIVEGTVTAWLKGEGDKIEEFEGLLEVETDKVTTEVPSPAQGTILKILVPEGKTVDAGTILAWIGEPGETVIEGEGMANEPDQESQVEATSNEPVETHLAGRDTDLGFISPVVARLAQEKNVDLKAVTGTGMGGRITKKDVLSYLRNREDNTQEDVPIWETPADGDLFRPTEMIFGETKESAVPQKPEKSTKTFGSILPLSPMRKRIADPVSYTHLRAHET